MSKPLVSRPKLKGGHESDHFQTPDYATKSIVPFLRAAGVRTIWECAAGRGIMARCFEREGFEVIATDILTGYDFFQTPITHNFDAIVTNIPFSLKVEFFKRAYQIGKPFAFLNPITIEGQLCRMFARYGMQEITPIQRIHYLTPEQLKSGLDYYWRCSNMNCKQVYRIAESPKACLECDDNRFEKRKYVSQIKTVWHTHGLSLLSDRVYIDLTDDGYPDQGDWRIK